MRPFLSSKFTAVIYCVSFVNHIYLITLPPLIKYFTLLPVYHCLFIDININSTVYLIMIYALLFIIIQVMYLHAILLKTTY